MRIGHYLFDLFAGEHFRPFPATFGKNHPFKLPQFYFQHVPIEKYQSAEGLVLSRSGYFALDRQVR